jgi:nitroreductase
MIKKTKTTYPINSLIEQRWSNRAFHPQIVETEKLNSILEAATWAPSAFNEQPWRFIVGQKGSATYEKIMDSLIEWNRRWASNANVLILNIAKKNFSHNKKPNPTCEYDLGQAVAFLALEAVNQGLFSHQMTGFDAEKLTAAFEISMEEYKVVSVIAVGYYGNADTLPADMLEAEKAVRERKDFKTIVLNGDFEILESSSLF